MSRQVCCLTKHIRRDDTEWWNCLESRCWRLSSSHRFIRRFHECSEMRPAYACENAQSLMKFCRLFDISSLDSNDEWILKLWEIASTLLQQLGPATDPDSRPDVALREDIKSVLNQFLSIFALVSTNVPDGDVVNARSIDRLFGSIHSSAKAALHTLENWFRD